MLSISLLPLLYYTRSLWVGGSKASRSKKFQCHLYGFAVSFLQSSKQSEVKAIFIYSNKAPRRANVPKILPKRRLDLLF